MREISIFSAPGTDVSGARAAGIETTSHASTEAPTHARQPKQSRFSAHRVNAVESAGRGSAVLDRSRIGESNKAATAEREIFHRARRKSRQGIETRRISQLRMSRRIALHGPRWPNCSAFS